MKIHLADSSTSATTHLYLLPFGHSLSGLSLSSEEQNFVVEQMEKQKKDWVVLQRYPGWVIVIMGKEGIESNKQLEHRRKQAVAVLGFLNSHGTSEAHLIATEIIEEEVLAFVEGFALSSYQFLKYRKDASDKQHSFQTLHLDESAIQPMAVELLENTIEAVCWARDLVNEPLNQLNAEDLATSYSEKLKAVGCKTEVFNKKKIEALKMGGLLAVNLGSVDPPTFTILEWKPEGALNQKPIVFVGKGVVYDTGGMSLKPSGSMETMKCDMAGSAAAAGIMLAAAKSKLPLHLIALVPATDNRVNGNAYVPGDVITMFDGTTVEVLNTDAEGRLILADALSYAKKFNPQLVVTFATLTGAASRAIGSQGIAAMHVKAEEAFQQFTDSGYRVHERLAAFPMWDEYKDQLKSEIADLKNIGGPEAGMITAAKFLEHFTDYPFVHFDIAGPAFLEKRDSYRGTGGTGVGIRLVMDYLVHLTKS